MKKINLKYLAVFGSVAVLFFVLFLFEGSFSGNVILNLEADYHAGENLDGILKLSLGEGEFIPASSVVVFESSGQRQEFTLEDIVSEEASEGEYYIKGKNLSGQGMGYGLMEIGEVSPEFSFVFNVYSESGDEVDVVEETPVVNGVESPIGNDSTDSEITGGVNKTEIVEDVNETESIGEVEEAPVVEEEAPVVEEEVEEETPIIEEEVPVVEGETEEPEEEVIEEVAEEPKDAVIEEVVEEETPIIEEEVPVVEGETEEPEEEVIEEVAEEPKDAEVEKESVVDKVSSAVSMSFASLLGLSPVTGQVILNLEESVNGKVSLDTPFNYSLKKGQTAELSSGSVMDGSTVVGDDNIIFEVKDDKVSVSSNYIEEGDGFEILEINLSAISLNFSEGDLEISFVYNNEELVSLSTFLEETETNETDLEEVPKISLENLTEDEREILVGKFGDILIKTTRAEVVNGRLIRNYKIGDYELVSSYDYDFGMTNSTREQMERDKINFLKDLAKVISEEEVVSEDVDEFLVSSSF